MKARPIRAAALTASPAVGAAAATPSSAGQATYGNRNGSSAERRYVSSASGPSKAHLTYEFVRGRVVLGKAAR